MCVCCVPFWNMCCAILKYVSDWHGVPFWNMCISETCFRLAPSKLCHIEGKQHYAFLTHWIWSNPTFITFITEKTNEQTNCSLALFLVSLHKNLCFRTLHLTCGFDMTKFALCQPKICFRMAKFFRMAHVNKIWNLFQDGTCFRTARNTYHTHFISYC